MSRDSQLLTPVKRYSISSIRANPDSFDKEVFRRIVHELYMRKEYPTIVYGGKVKVQCGFPGGDIACGEFCKSWALPTKNETRRNMSTGSHLSWNRDIYAYKVCANYDK